MTRKQTVIVKLKRSSTGKPWGIRIAGGADLGTPIVVTRVSSSSSSFISSAEQFVAIGCTQLVNCNLHICLV